MPVRSGAAQLSRQARDIQKTFLVNITLMREPDVSDAFRNVRIDPDEALNLYYTVREFVLISFV